MPQTLLSKFLRLNESTTEQASPEKELLDPAWVVDEESEGHLAIDVYRTRDALIVKSTIAGVDEDAVDIQISNDMLTIKGHRQRDEVVAQEDYYYQECYWGVFSRTIVLPMEIISDGVEASLKKGVLTIRMPLAQRNRSIKVRLHEE